MYIRTAFSAFRAVPASRIVNNCRPRVSTDLLHLDSANTGRCGPHSRQEVGQAVVPCSLVGEGEMGVGWTRVRHDVEPSRADSLPLAPKHCHWVGASQRELEERSIRGEPVKTGDARLVALKFFEQTWYPLRKVPGAEIRRVSGWTFDNVRKTNPEARKLSILLWTEGVGTDRSPHALAQLRRGERGPEPARRTREVVSTLNRVEPGIDPNEDEVEP